MKNLLCKNQRKRNPNKIILFEASTTNIKKVMKMTTQSYHINEDHHPKKGENWKKKREASKPKAAQSQTFPLTP